MKFSRPKMNLMPCLRVVLKPRAIPLEDLPFLCLVARRAQGTMLSCTRVSVIRNW